MFLTIYIPFVLFRQRGEWWIEAVQMPRAVALVAHDGFIRVLLVAALVTCALSALLARVVLAVITVRLVRP